MPDIAPVPSPSLPSPTTAPTVAPASRPADPVVAQPAPPDAPQRAPEALQRQLDEVLKQADSSLRFRVDDEVQRVVVTVLDGSGEVIMQIPDEAALAVARHLARTGSLLDARA